MSENQASILFRTTPDCKQKFDSIVSSSGRSNKFIFESFMLKFIESPDATLKFIGIK